MKLLMWLLVAVVAAIIAAVVMAMPHATDCWPDAPGPRNPEPSEQGLKQVAGWSDRSMVDRYTRATAGDRALDEARGLGLGDL